MRSRSLDALRGVAIAQVVIWHYWGNNHSAPVLIRALTSQTWSGVDLFFVLSGYLIGGILIDNRDAANYFRVFYARRFFRIAPLYFALLAIFAIANGGLLLSYLTLTQNFAWSAMGAWGSPMTGITWSLAVEEQFYLVLPIMIRFIAPRRLPLVALGLVVLAPAVRAAAVWWYGNPYSAYMLMPCRMDALFAGVLCACATRNPAIAAAIKMHRRWLFAALVIGSFGLAGLMSIQAWALSAAMQGIGYSFLAVFYTLALLAVVTSNNPLGVLERPLSWLGIGAYSIYLFHNAAAMAAQSLSLPQWTALAGILALSALAWRYIERPLIGYARDAFRYHSGRRAPATMRLITPASAQAARLR